MAQRNGRIWRRVAAGAVVAFALLAPSAPAGALPASYVVDTQPRMAGAVAIVGDSLTVSYIAGLPATLRSAGFGPFQIEARSARRTIVGLPGVTPGIEGVRHIRASGFDPQLWVIALGTNDINPTARPVGAADLTVVALLDEIGPGHRVVWVNTFAAGSDANARAFNERLTGLAARRPNLVIADWYSFAAAHPRWLRDDGVHPTPAGAVQRNEFVVQQAFAARPLPPARDPIRRVQPTRGVGPGVRQ